MEWNFGKENCIVCGSPYVQIHHVFHGTANRKKADKWGYVIPLCAEHHTGQTGVHMNRDQDLYWMRLAQKHFEKNYGTREDFIKEFGRSWLDE